MYNVMHTQADPCHRKLRFLLNPIFSIYLKREGYVPGNPSTQPITVAHFMVDGGSDDASVLQQAVTPDESLGDGLKVYKDSFNAY